MAIGWTKRSKNSKVLIGAVPKITADSYTYLLDSIGLMPIDLEIEAISLARAMITSDKNYIDEARALLDLGATRSGLIIYDNNTIQFSTSLNYSGEIIDTAIAQELKITHQAAEELKIKNGVRYQGKDKQNIKYIKIISRLNNQLVADLKTTMEFYSEHFSGHNTINHITMSGGMANWSGLDNFLSAKLKISSHPGDAWKNLGNEKEKYDRAQGVSLAAAIGLALRASQRPFVI